MRQLAERLLAEQGRKCYEVCCGGSNLLGTFGYLHAVTELMQQASQGRPEQAGEQQQQGEVEGGKRAFPYDHLVFGCGSGGTAAGLAIGVHLAGLDVQVRPLLSLILANGFT